MGPSRRRTNQSEPVDALLWIAIGGASGCLGEELRLGAGHRSMLAGAAGQTSRRTPYTWPESRLEDGNASLEILDVTDEGLEVDLAERGALDRVRRVVHDVRRRHLSAAAIDARTERRHEVGEPRVDHEGAVRETAIERILRDGLARTVIEYLDRIPGPKRNAPCIHHVAASDERQIWTRAIDRTQPRTERIYPPIGRRAQARTNRSLADTGSAAMLG